MKTIRTYWAAILFAALMTICTVAAMGQTNEVVLPALDATAPSWLLDLVGKYPWVATVLLVVGVLRLSIKPVFSILHAYTASTETKSDDEFLAKVESSKYLKWLLWVLDYLTSVKLKK